MELKNKITELKNSIERCNSRLEYRVKRLNEPEDRTFEIIHTDTKKMKKKLRGLLFTIKQTNIHLVEVSGEEEGEKR